MHYYQKVLFKVDVHLLSSSVSRNVESWEANYVLVVTQHTGGSEGIITSCVVITIHLLVGFLHKSDLLINVVHASLPETTPSAVYVYSVQPHLQSQPARSLLVLTQSVRLSMFLASS